MSYQLPFLQGDTLYVLYACGAFYGLLLGWVGVRGVLWVTAVIHRRKESKAFQERIAELYREKERSKR